MLFQQQPIDNSNQIYPNINQGSLENPPKYEQFIKQNATVMDNYGDTK